MFDETAAIEELLAEAWRSFAPPAPLTVAEWADEKLILPKQMSAEPGPLRLSRTPYLRQIFDDLADPAIEEIVLCFATQLGKSTALLALMGYVIDHDPSPIMMVLPTVEVARRFSRQRIAPLIAANANIAVKIRDSRARDSGNTTTVKEFARGDGALVITGANAPSGLASMPARILLFDEVDDYPDDAGGQGPPIAIATARQDTFTPRKRVKSSSPKRPTGQSTIEAEYQAGTRNEYFVPCPHCGTLQTLRWENLKWHDHDPNTVAYACEGCGTLIDEHYKTGMLAGGRWQAGNPAGNARSYRLNSLYSPAGWLGWRSLVSEYLDAKARASAGDLGRLRTFRNTRLAETWEEVGERLMTSDLEKRAEPFRLGIVPAGGLVLVAFTDIQDNRFELGVWALGENDEMWTVDHRVIPADPGRPADWEKLDAALLERYPCAGGGSLAIEAAGIDTGGHFTHDVYRYVRKTASNRRIHATKGMDRPGMPVKGRASSVDVNFKGGIIKGGVKLWIVGVNQAKDILFGRIRAGRVHISQQLSADWFAQLTAEQRIKKRTARGERYVWVKKAMGSANEALDIAVGAIWCGERLGVSGWTPKYWDDLRKKLEASPSLAAPKPPPAPLPGAVARPQSWQRQPRIPGANFITGWRR